MFSKRTKIILLVVFSIISILYIICSYYGITRYASMRYLGNKNIKKVNLLNYSKLGKADDKRVVLSLTTTPDKLNNIKPMLNSILDQTVKVDQIALNLPKDKFENIQLPNSYDKFLNVFYTGTDYGKYEDIIPTLLREGDVDTKIIVLNDSVIYGIDFVKSMIEESNNNPDSVIIDKKNSAILLKPKFIDVGIDQLGDLDIYQYLIQTNKVKYINLDETYSYM